MLRFLTYLPIVLFLNLSIFDPACAGYLDINDQRDSAVATRQYNLLDSVENSDKALKAHPNREAAMDELSEVLTHHRVNDVMGLRLVHRHHILEGNQVMVEKPTSTKGAPSLTTSAWNITDARSSQALPASWTFGAESGISIFETSTDAAVARAHKRLSDTLFDEVGSVLRRHKMTHLLSLAILDRDTLKAGNGQLYMEDSFGTQSVITLCTAQEAKDTIRTTWSFNGPKQVGCAKYFVCKKVDSHYGNHQHFSFHDRQ